MCSAQQQDAAPVEAMIKQLGADFTYPVALDRSKHVAVAYPRSTIPHAYIIGVDGNVAWSGHPNNLDAAIEVALAKAKMGGVVSDKKSD
jgi:hypothetical protein